MVLDGIEPIDLMHQRYAIQAMRPAEIVLAHPVEFLVTGDERGDSKPQLFVRGGPQGRHLYHVGPASADVQAAHAASQVLATYFPGVTFRERLADGQVRTLVQCLVPGVVGPAVDLPWPPPAAADRAEPADGLGGGAGADAVQNVEEWLARPEPKLVVDIPAHTSAAGVGVTADDDF